ncbi:MAG: hypothetical protein HJJLKODD_03007 [Phycisphaerae bacterium]|nr:hypothetical protein [Phycisphaerae bacterium]
MSFSDDPSDDNIISRMSVYQKDLLDALWWVLEGIDEAANAFLKVMDDGYFGFAELQNPIPYLEELESQVREFPHQLEKWIDSHSETKTTECDLPKSIMKAHADLLKDWTIDKIRLSSREFAEAVQSFTQSSQKIISPVCISDADELWPGSKYTLSDLLHVINAELLTDYERARKESQEKARQLRPMVEGRNKILKAISELGDDAKPDSIVKKAKTSNAIGRVILRQLQSEGKYHGFTR